MFGCWGPKEGVSEANYGAIYLARLGRLESVYRQKWGNSSKNVRNVLMIGQLAHTKGLGSFTITSQCVWGAFITSCDLLWMKIWVGGPPRKRRCWGGDRPSPPAQRPGHRQRAPSETQSLPTTWGRRQIGLSYPGRFITSVCELPHPPHPRRRVG